MRYYKPEGAVAELKRRQSDSALVTLVASVMGQTWNNCPIPMGLYGFLARQVASCRLEEIQFVERCESVGLQPFQLEYTGDQFTTRSLDKMRLTRILVGQGAGRNGGEKVFSYHLIRRPAQWEGRSLMEMIADNGEPLTEFHHRLRQTAFEGRDDHFADVTSWLWQLGRRAREFYYGFLTAFTVRGILFEDFTADGNLALSRFDGQVVYAACQKVIRTIGVEPLIVRHPECATKDEERRTMDYYSDKVIPLLCR